MEVKKNPKYDLRKKSGLFFSIGMVVSLSLTITAFEWKSYGDPMPELVGELSGMDDDLLMIPVTEHEPPKPPKPPKKEIIPEEVIEVPNETDLEDQPDFTPQDDIEDLEFDPLPEPVDEPEEDITFTIVEKQPQPEGGMGEFYKFIGKEMRYPASARRMGIEGRVFVQFVVDKEGNLTNVEVIKGINEACDAEAIRVLEKSPKWIPGKQRGRPVKVRMVLPIIFRLN